MPKGKKFDAAEKHFEKKRIEYARRIKYLEEQLDKARKELRTAKSVADFVERENEELKIMVSKLNEYCKLDRSLIKAACEKDAQLARTLKWLNDFGGLSLDTYVNDKKGN